MVAAITLGIAIDDTLHLLVRSNRELGVPYDERQAVKATLHEEIKPIVTTSVALAGGFLVMGFSGFQPIREFGLLSAGVMMIATVTDLVITSVFLAITRIVTLWDVWGFTVRQQLLEQSPLFQGFNQWRARKLILACTIEEFSAGSPVIREGDLGDKMFVVPEGELEATLTREASVRSVGLLREGDVFGEFDLVSASPRTADITARNYWMMLGLNNENHKSIRRFSP